MQGRVGCAEPGRTALGAARHLAQLPLLLPCSQHGSVLFGAARVWWTLRRCGLRCCPIEALMPEGKFQQ